MSGMGHIVEPEKKIPIIADTDLLVCGGGFAGFAAAVAGAQSGARVLLVEKYGFLGGLCTAALVVTTPPLDNGINIQIARRLREMGGSAPIRRSKAEERILEISIDPEIIKYEFSRMLREWGVGILLHTYVVAVIMEANLIRGVIVESKSGRRAIRARVVVDATGDADISAFAGAPLRLVKKPMTMMFNMIGVDTSKVLAEFGNYSGIKKLVRKAIDKGELVFDLSINPEFGAPGIYAEKLVYDGQLNVWSGNLLGMNGIDQHDLTQAEITTREHVLRLAAFLKKNAPGFEKSRIEYTANQVGVRATRQIIGEATPTMDEIGNRRFDDTIAKPYAKGEIRLPYGCILPQNIENLLVAGRCISAEEEALGKLRLIPVCSATGQAAGTAAALALNRETSPRDIDVPLLQKILQEKGMKLGIGK
jgi:ribulose 1,5-bisphosphate synthetase/thiazole synthase